VSPDADGDDDRPQASARTRDATPARSASESATLTGKSATSTNEQPRGSDTERSHGPDGEQVRQPSEDGGASIEADGFGAKGWALTAVLFVSVVVIPGIIYVYPYAAGGLGFTFFATYLALPLVPAALLGLVAVWSMTAATADE